MVNIAFPSFEFRHLFFEFAFKPARRSYRASTPILVSSSDESESEAQQPPPSVRRSQRMRSIPAYVQDEDEYSKKWTEPPPPRHKGSVYLQTYYRIIAAVSVKYENRYRDARNAPQPFNHPAHPIEKNRQSSRGYANLMDWTAVLNRSGSRLPPVMEDEFPGRHSAQPRSRKKMLRRGETPYLEN